MCKLILLLAFLILLYACGTKIPSAVPLKYAQKTIAVPEPFAPGIISTKEASEFNLSFMPDGRSVYFTRRTGNEKQKIWRTTFTGGNWSSPEVCSFSTDRDEAPFITPDGKTLYFGSTRPIDGRPSGGNFDMNIWKAEKSGADWKAPTPLGSEINAVQGQKEEWPSSNESFLFTPDGVNFLYTTMLRGTKTIEIYQTTKTGDTFSTPVRVDSLFTSEKFWKSSAISSPDGKYLLFNSYGAEGGAGGEDIFVCKKTHTGWTKAKSLGSLVNTKAEEGSPRFSPDGSYFFFSRELKDDPEKDGIWEIFYVETKYLHLDSLFENQNELK